MTSETQTTRRGWVIDALTRQPLQARVAEEGGAVVATTLPRGEFLLPPNARHEGSVTYRVSARGYQTQTLERSPKAAEIGLIEMTPTGTARLQVQDSEGQPLEGKAVHWLDKGISVGEAVIGESQSTGLNGRTPLFRNLTDSAGWSQVPAGQTMIATVYWGAETGPSVAVFVEPGVDQVVVLPERCARLRFVDGATGEPCSDQRVEWLDATRLDAGSQHATTDAEGWLRIPQAQGHALLRQPTAVQETIWSLQQELTPKQRQQGSARLAVELQTESPITVYVHRDPRYLLVLDAVDDSPVHDKTFALKAPASGQGGASGINAARYLSSPRVSRTQNQIARSLPFRVLEGKIRFPANGKFDELGKRSGSPIPTLWVEGYQPFALEDWEAYRSGRSHGPIRLQPSQVRSLQVLFEDGNPYQGRLWIYSDTHQLSLETARHGEDGLSPGVYGPFDWMDGDLTVETDFGTQVIPASEWQKQDMVTLHLPVSTGSVRIDSVPAESLVWIGARSLHTYQWLPGRPAEASEWEIDGLAPGRYVVGPESWTRVTAMHAFRAPGDAAPVQSGWAEVKAGEATRMTWNPDWSSAQAIEGRITVSSELEGKPFVVPMYGLRHAKPGEEDWRPSLVFNNEAIRIPLDASGTYRIASGDPVPDLLLVGLPEHRPHRLAWGNTTGFLLVGSVLPGHSRHFATQGVELRWEGSSEALRHIQIHAADEDHDLSVDSNYHSRALTWKPKSPSDRRWVHGVSKRIREVEVDGTFVPIQTTSSGAAFVTLPDSIQGE